MPTPPPGPLPVAATRWRSIRGLTTGLTVFLWLAAADAVLGIVAFALRIRALGKLLDDGPTFEGVHRAQDADDVVRVAVGFMVLLTFVILVLIVIWTFRAAKNNEALGRIYPRFKPGWAIAGWLIPFASLVIPVLILQDLWRGSEVATPRGDPSWRSNPGSTLIGWYWGAFLVSSIRLGVGRGNARFFVPDELRELRVHDTVALLGMAVTVAAAVLAIRVVRTIAARQETCLRAQRRAALPVR